MRKFLPPLTWVLGLGRRAGLDRWHETQVRHEVMADTSAYGSPRTGVVRNALPGMLAEPFSKGFVRLCWGGSFEPTPVKLIFDLRRRLALDCQTPAFPPGRRSRGAGTARLKFF